MATIRHRHQRGFSMIEVLITLIIILVALLGIAALQSRAQIAELESLQRSQALILLSNIMDLMNANRATVTCFAFTTNTTTGTPFVGASGSGSLSSPTCTASTTEYNAQAVDTLGDIGDMLKGTAEKVGTQNVGAMIGARACISYDSSTELTGQPGTGLYNVIVTWQGMADLIAPTSSMKCAVGLYGDETRRRAVAAKMRFADLL